MNESGALLNLAASDLVQASRGSANELAVSSQKYSKSFENLMNPGMQLAGQTTVKRVWSEYNEQLFTLLYFF